ncbi:YkgJ family cysteine cluster protein [Roseateles amylovorans]|uniref:YkgJ family cysteine cluster protein n=1 Tax=Roseateles amylovorans TaxID=2978473 RepID=A0ABY6AV34_9BURK|nr:YkgJ family cysteine cluster protein [Roseateles amylovorans]UXH76239.1 YkgJ family cysteine cluster protein [Roseateles amylovorans]
MDFPCTSCGRCCRQLPAASVLNLGDGVCRHLDPASQRCTVYVQRPLVCRVDDLYRQRLAGSISKRVYYLLQAHACAEMDARNLAMPAEVALQLTLEMRSGGSGVGAGTAVDMEAGLTEAVGGHPAAHRVGVPVRLDPDEAAEAMNKLMAVAATLLEEPAGPQAALPSASMGV